MDPLQGFADLVSVPDEEIDLGRAAATVGLAAYPDTDIERCMLSLDELAAGVTDLGGLRERLFGELGFTGDRATYSDPDNSLLHRVLERRLGIPVTLSVLAMEVGRRAGVPLEPIGMPGHFLLWDPYADSYLDAYNGGVMIDEAGCEILFRHATGAGAEIEFTRDLLPVTSNAGILVRILNNLVNVYRGTGRPADLEWALRLRLALPEVSARDVVGLAEALAAQGRTVDAIAELESWAAVSPELAGGLAAASRELIARLN